RRDARRNLVVLRAFPARARVEECALDAAVDVDAALGARIENADRRGQQIPAAGAAEHFVRRHQVRRLGPALVLQHASRRAFLRGRRPLLATRLAVALVVLIASLPVLPIAHRSVSITGPPGWNLDCGVARSGRSPRPLPDPGQARRGRNGRSVRGVTFAVMERTTP